MPAGTDVITWEPRVGDTGDDRYTWPEDHGLEAGPSDIYSNPPTIGQVLKGRGYNQLIAEIRRRQYQTNWNWYNTTPPTYATPENAVIGNTTSSTSPIIRWLSIKNAINDVMSFERQSAITWPTIPEMPWYWPRWDDPISVDFKQWMLTARKALALDHVRVYPLGSSQLSYVRSTYPADPLGDFYRIKTEAPATTWGGNNNMVFFGQELLYSSTRQSMRASFKFDIPSLTLVDDGVEFDPDEARISALYRQVGNTYAAFVAELRDATKLIYESADWSSYGTLIESWTIPSTGLPQSKTHVISLPQAGLKYFFLIGEKERLDSSGITKEHSDAKGKDFYIKLYTAAPPPEE